jgi:hypothetical protein
MSRILKPILKNRILRCNTDDASFLPFFGFVLLLLCSTGWVLQLAASYNEIYINQCATLLLWVSIVFVCALFYIGYGLVVLEQVSLHV